MPILHVEIVGEPSEFSADLAQQLAEAAGSALDSRPRGTWVTLNFVKENRYAENGGADSRPLIVTLLQADLPSGDALRQQVDRLTQAIATTAEHPFKNVHLVLEPSGRGRVAFGGKLVE